MKPTLVFLTAPPFPLKDKGNLSSGIVKALPIIIPAIPSIVIFKLAGIKGAANVMPSVDLTAAIPFM